MYEKERFKEDVNKIQNVFDEFQIKYLDLECVFRKVRDEYVFEIFMLQMEWFESRESFGKEKQNLEECL